MFGRLKRLGRIPDDGDNCDHRFCSATSCIQIGYGIWVNLNVINVGYAFGFAAVAIPQLKNDSVFQPTIEETAWIASVIMLTAPVGCLASGFMIDILGRKASLVVSEVLLCGAWAYSAFVYSINDIIIGRALVGIGLGFVLVSPCIYATEITLPKMRGLIGAFSSCAIAVGITIEDLLGLYYNWRYLCYFHVGYCFCLAIFNFFLPESPYYILMTRPDATEISVLLKKFRSKNYAINQEISDLKAYKADNDIRRLTWKEKRTALLMPSAIKTFCIVLMLIIFGQFSGITVLQFYAVEILQASKSSVDPHLGNVLLGITRLLSSILASALLYKVGRKPLAYVSFIGVGVTAVTLGTYIFRVEEKYAYPEVCYMIYVLFASLGHYFLYMLIMSEIYPLQIRGTLGGISFCVISLMIFCTTKIFPYMIHAIGIHYLLIFFGVVSLLGLVFIYLFMPETKDLTLVEIEEYFSGLRPTLRSNTEIKKAQSHKALLSILKVTSQQTLRHNQVYLKKISSKVRLNVEKDLSELSEINRDSEQNDLTKKDQEEIEMKSKQQTEDKYEGIMIMEVENENKKDLNADQETGSGTNEKPKDEDGKKEGDDDKSITPGTSTSDRKILD